jgi:hypothetical protein
MIDTYVHTTVVLPVRHTGDAGKRLCTFTTSRFYDNPFVSLVSTPEKVATEVIENE